ncbi:MAG: sugar ABC transporter substrate-binding protein [Clostridiaceae bacterium]|nr:sugar ABC transporter substrate-binding protein [Clostridiaceae bacterium]
MKKALSLLLALMLILSLAACGGSDETTGTTAATEGNTTEAEAETTAAPESSDETEAEAEPVTLKWALWDLDQTAYYKAIMDAYKTVAPNVTIEPTDLGSADYMNMLQTQLAGGSDFDVVTIKDVPGYANLVAQDQLEPLNAFIAEAGIDTAQYGGTTDQVTVEGELYQLPFRSDFWVVLYNKDIFDSQGVDYPDNDMTLEEYDEIARKLVNGEGNEKVYGAHYHTWRSAVQLFSILDGKHTVVDGTYSWMAPYYEMILKQQDDGIVMDYATAVSTSSHYRDLFYNSNIAMMNMGTWQIGSQIMAVADGTTDVANWGVVKYPHPDGIEAGTTLGTITGVSVSKNAPNKEAALDFIGWLSGPEGAKVVAGTGTIPAIHTAAVMDSITSLDGFPEDQNSKDALQTAKVYLEMPIHPQAGEIEVVLNEEHTEIMTGAKSIEDGLAAMERRVAEIIG